MEQLIVTLLRIALINGFVSILMWITVYSRVAKWWRNPVGRTIVIFAALVAALLVPTTLSLFFRLNRNDSLAVAWADVALIGAVAPVMCWRVVTWGRIARYEREQARQARGARDRPGDGQQG